MQNLNLCGPQISTSKDLSFADPVYDPIAYGQDQIKIGCVPCSSGPNNSPSQVVFILPGCQYICKRDPANQTEPDYYCRSPLNAAGGCTQQCLDCAGSLLTLKPPAVAGYYLLSCQDGVGYSYAPCLSLPSNAFFTSNAQHVGDSQGCAWQCNAGFQQLGGGCVPCARHPTCTEGQVLQACQSGFQQFYCAPCTVVNGTSGLLPMQVWYSSADFRTCVADCEAGYSVRNSTADMCQLCSTPTCLLDQRLVLCTRSVDTQCLPCAPPPLPANSEYYAAGTCLTRCAQGYAASGGNQTACQPCASIACAPGSYVSSACQTPQERLALPTCLPCPFLDIPQNRPSQGRIYVQRCTTSCQTGWMQTDPPFNLTCVPCNGTECPVGYYGLCSQGALQCSPCPGNLADRSKTFAGPGNCTQICALNYVQRTLKPLVCVPQPAAQQPSILLAPSGDASTQNTVWGVDLSLLNSSNTNASEFPVRSLPHS